MSTHGDVLLSIARGTLHEKLGGPKLARPEGAFLEEPRAVFVTLTIGGELRGCIGQLEPRFTLYEAVREAAHAAGFSDPRFPPLQSYELAKVHIEISVLSPVERLDVRTEAEALQAIRPGVDGVVLRWGGRSGVFIPEVWKSLPDPEEFLFHLKRKAGLPTDTWLEGTFVERFTAQVWHEPHLN